MKKNISLQNNDILEKNILPSSLTNLYY